MSDTPTPPTPPAPEDEPKQTHGDIDKKLLADIKLGEDVFDAATTDPGHTSALNNEGLDAEALPNLTAYTGNARELASRVVPTKNTVKAATLAEKNALQTLMAALRDIQKRVRSKYPADKTTQASYLIGKDNLGKNRTDLEEDAETILNQATSDALPGLTPAKLTAAGSALNHWKQADQTQAAALESQGKLLNDLAAKVGQINQVRRAIQRAADLAWPHPDVAHAPIRRTFKLPPDRPFVA